MTVGMFLAALAFIVAALVQIQIDVSVTHIKTYNTVQLFMKQNSLSHTHTSPFPFQKTMPQFPSSKQGQTKFINMLDTQLNVKAGHYNITLSPYTVPQTHT